MVDKFSRYLKVYKDDCAEAKAFRKTLREGLKKRSYPHLVDDAIRLIQSDIRRGQDATPENLEIMFHNIGVLSGNALLLPDAVVDAVKILRDGKSHGMVEQMIRDGRYDELHDPHWTGD